MDVDKEAWKTGAEEAEPYVVADAKELAAEVGGDPKDVGSTTPGPTTIRSVLTLRLMSGR
jgi:hypothetical protein